jgi:lysine biosynthesis protein LysW
MSAKCPECGFDFSSKPDFLRYAEPGEIIQCPDCGTELEVGKDRSLSVVELEDLDWGESDRGSK